MPSTIFYNPAGLSKLTDTQLLVVASGVLHQVRIQQ